MAEVTAMCTKTARAEVVVGGRLRDSRRQLWSDACGPVTCSLVHAGVGHHPLVDGPPTHGHGEEAQP